MTELPSQLGPMGRASCRQIAAWWMPCSMMMRMIDLLAQFRWLNCPHSWGPGRASCRLKWTRRTGARPWPRGRGRCAGWTSPPTCPSSTRRTECSLKKKDLIEKGVNKSKILMKKCERKSEEISTKISVVSLLDAVLLSKIFMMIIN